jgi:hypothetical protein
METIIQQKVMIRFPKIHSRFAGSFMEHEFER